MKCPRARMREVDDHSGLSFPREETSPSRRSLSRVLPGQWRIACSKVSGAEAHRGQVLFGS